MVDIFHSADVFSDSPCYGLIPEVKKYFPHAAVVATNRSKRSWVSSMTRNPGRGWLFLQSGSALIDPQVFNRSAEQFVNGRWTPSLLSTVYDHHQTLLRQYGIVTINLEDSDQRKFQALFAACPHVRQAVETSPFGSIKNMSWVCSNAVGFTGSRGTDRCRLIDGKPNRSELAGKLPRETNNNSRNRKLFLGVVVEVE